MSLIGIITNQKHMAHIEKYLEKDLKKIKASIIYINSKSIENVKNIKFDIIIICEMFEEIKEKERYVREILRNSKYLILNADMKIEPRIFEGINMKTITYGLKQKSTITASSIADGKIIICIQRAFQNLKNNVIDSQEVKEKLEKNNIKNIYNALIKVAIINIHGV